jgi:hypothetical protein
MIHPDPHATLLLVRERQAELRRDALPAGSALRGAVESRRRRRRLRLRLLWTRVHAPGGLS